MHPNLLALAAVLPLLATALEADGACTGGNPNFLAIESTPTSAFTVHDNGTITHHLTGLMWKRCTQGLSGEDCATGTPPFMSWSAALADAVVDTTANYRDWRLPSIKELESIVETCGFAPPINEKIFPATRSQYYWSGSTYAPNPLYAWVGGNEAGETAMLNKIATAHSRLVRGGLSFGSFDANHPGTIDVDGNGTADALTDGLLVIRYLFGLRGTALIQGAVGAGAVRTSATEIEQYLQSVMP